MKFIKIRSIATRELVADYINAFNNVSRYATSAMACQIPALVLPPAHYSDYANALSNAKMHTSIWTNGIMSDISLVPKTFINFNTQFQTQFEKVIEELNQLKQDGDNNQLATEISSQVNEMIIFAGEIKKTISDLDTIIANYQATILPDAETMNQLARQIAIAEQADEAEIAKMQSIFSSLQAIVDKRNQLKTLDTLSNFDLSIFLAVVGIGVSVALSGNPSIIVGGIIGVGASAYTTFWPVSSDIEFEQSINDLQSQMNSINSEIGLMNSTIGLLQQLANNFTTLSNQSGEVGNELKKVYDFWHSQELDLIALNNELTATLTQLNNADEINAAIININEAKLSWNEFYEFLLPLENITYNIEVTEQPSV